MIKLSIYRQGGTLNWNSTIKQIKESFAMTKPEFDTVEITAGDKGFGKSTVFEFLSTYAPGISLEGDIMSVIGLTLTGGVDLKDDMRLGDLANGRAVPGFIPWEVKRVTESAYQAALTKFLGEGYNRKISLCTAFHGGDVKASLIVVPDYVYYKKNMETRTSYMVSDKSKSDAWRAHVRKKHVVLSWPEFLVVNREVVEKVQKWKVPIAFIPNLDAGTLEMFALSALQVLLPQISTRRWGNGKIILHP